MGKNKTILAYWALAAISLFWGSTWFVAKIAVQHIPPFQLTGYRQTLAGLILMLFFLVKDKKVPPLKNILFHVLMGFLFFTCSNGLTTMAVQYIPSFLGALLGCLFPFALILADFLFFKVRLKNNLIAALFLGFVGIATILLSFSKEMSGKNFALGIVLTLIGVCTWTIGTLISTKMSLKIDPLRGIGWQMFFGGIFLLINSQLFENPISFHQISSVGWLSFMYLTLVGSLISFVCYIYALKILPLNLVSIYVYINPIVAFLLGVLFLDEKFTLQVIVGIIITFVAIYFVKKLNTAKLN
ncbi:MAG: EamA family transporter [Chitinophagaceae bacterium]